MVETKKSLETLNDKQQAAILSKCERLLVLAGAGSGKTKTLLQKLTYLIKEKKVKPSNILAITFTKNAANEMLDRLILSADATGKYTKILSGKNSDIDSQRYIFKNKHHRTRNLTLKTFHALCYGILKDSGVSEFDNKFKIIGAAKERRDEFISNSSSITSFEITHKILIALCESNVYLLELKRYILDYMVDKIHIENKSSSPPRDGKYYTALDGTKVKSKSEQFIADWLYRHGIDYEYEKKVNFSDFPFKPDFYIPEADIYLEHKSNLSHPLKNKIKQFQKAGKTLEITHEKHAEDTSLFNSVLEKVIKNRLPADYHFTSALSFEEEFSSYHEEISKFLKDVLQVIGMIKVENVSTDIILEKSKKDQHERVRDFYKLAIPIIDRYASYCTDKSYLDLDDLIIKTIALFENRPEILTRYRKKYKYVLVDEFQDVNNLQVAFLKLLLASENQLFCVGDDWQSIFGFRGSNVDYIVNFKNHFKNSEIVKLSLNYRSTRNIVDASNEVIKHNKFKVSKTVTSLKESASKIHVYAGKSTTENVEFALSQVKRLKEEGLSKDDILFLYRRKKMYSDYAESFRRHRQYVSHETIHSAKGLEAKAVFIVGLKDGKGGFPDIWLEDRIYQIIKESNYDVLLEEERRLFYVAITRAKEQLFLITEEGNESSFLTEIPDILKLKSSEISKLVDVEILQCHKCNYDLKEAYRYCPHCGCELNPSKSKKMKTDF